MFSVKYELQFFCVSLATPTIRVLQWRTDGLFGGFKPPPQIPKALQNRAKLNPIVKTVKNC